MQYSFQYLQRFLKEYIGLDERSLALMRVLVSIVVIIDLFTRLLWIRSFYGVTSVYPPSLVLQTISSGPIYTLFLLVSKVPILPLLVFLIAGISSMFLLVGWYTRVASIGTWFCILILQTLNPLLLQGGDDVMRLVLFIGMFLPWGARYSVDSALRFEIRETVLVASPWTFAFIIQICAIYFFAFFEKSLGVPWLGGSGVYYALSIQQFATPFSHFLYSYPLVMMLISYTVRILQFVAVMLILSPFYSVITRTSAIVALIIMHFSFALHLRIGIFSWICIACLTGLIPTRTWRYIASLMDSIFNSITIYYDGDCGFCKKSVYLIRCFLLMPGSQIKKAQDYPLILKQMRLHDSWVIENKQGQYSYTFEAFITIIKHSPLLFWLSNLLSQPAIQAFGEKGYRFVARNRSKVCFEKRILKKKYQLSREIGDALYYVAAVYFIILIFWWNLAHLPTSRVIFPPLLNEPMKILGLSQQWNLFAPRPTDVTGWYTLNVIKTDGTQYNLLKSPTQLDAYTPQDPSNIFPNDRWRKYFMNISSDTKSLMYGGALGESVCHNWNIRIKQKSEHAESVILTYYSQLTELNYNKGPQQIKILAKVSCNER